MPNNDNKIENEIKALVAKNEVLQKEKDGLKTYIQTLNEKIKWIENELVICKNKILEKEALLWMIEEKEENFIKFLDWINLILHKNYNEIYAIICYLILDIKNINRNTNTINNRKADLKSLFKNTYKQFYKENKNNPEAMLKLHNCSMFILFLFKRLENYTK